jgi:hypothetical protein
MGTAKKKTTSTKKTRGKKAVKKEPTGPLTMNDLLDRLCPKIEFENEDEMIVPDHPILGSRLRWIPTPIESNEPMRQLYYILTDNGTDMRENERLDLIQELETQYSVRTPTSKTLHSLSQHMDTNIIVINQNTFHVIAPDMKVFNTARHSVLTYFDGISYHCVEEPEYVLATLLETNPETFRKIVRHDTYGRN